MMKNLKKNSIGLCIGAFILTGFVFTTCECVTSTSRDIPSSLSSGTTGSKNVFVSVAKSLANEALSQFQESARRNPRLGFNITMLLPPSFLNMTGGNNNKTGFNPSPNSFLETAGQLGFIGLKGGLLGLKAAIIQSVVLVLFIVFLLAGIAYFACNIGIISCSNLGSTIGGGNTGSGGPSQFGLTDPFSRTGYDYQNLQRSTSAVYNAIDDGQKKYT